MGKAFIIKLELEITEESTYDRIQEQMNQDNFDGNTNGFTPLVPTLQMNGGSKVNIVLNLPEAVAQLASGGTIVIVVTLRGFLSLGASNFNLK